MTRYLITGGVLAALLLAVFLILPDAETPPAPAAGQHEEEEEGGPRPNKPDIFYQYHQDIRRDDEAPARVYPPNYRLAALQEARVLARQAAKAGSWATRQLPWVERGPANVSGRTRGLLVDPRDAAGNTWYAGSVGGGIWKTTDAGRTWRNLTPDLPNLATVSLAQAASNLDVIYAGTGEDGFFNIDAISGDGIFKSTDGGETWTQLAATAGQTSFSSVTRLAVDPANADVVVATTGAGIFRTTDGGASWTQVLSSGVTHQVVATPGDFSTLYATGWQTGVFKSTDGGQSWQQVFDWNDHYGGAGIKGRLELAVAPSAPNRVYVTVDDDPNSDLWMSDDRGATWERVLETGGTPPHWLGGQGWYDNTIAVHPFDPNVVYVGGIALWRIQVTGSVTAPRRTTTQITGGTGVADVHADHHNIVAFVLDEGQGQFRLLNANDGGLAHTDDGGQTWTETVQFSGGYNTTQFYGADKRPGSDEFIGGMQDNGTWRSNTGQSANATTQWLPQLGGDGFMVAWHAENPNLIMGGSQYNNFARSVNGGRSWDSALEGMTDTGSGTGGKFISTLAKSQSDPDLVFTTGDQGVWRTDDFGERWRLATFTEDANLWDVHPSRVPVAISVADPQVVWAGSRNRSTGRAFVSEDAGLTFRPTSRADGVNATITNFATHPTDPNTAYMLFSVPGSTKIFRTTDLGATWEPITGTFNGNATLSSNGFPNVATYSLLVMPFDPDVLWAGTEIGLFVSEDGGQTWLRGETGLPAVSLWQLSIVDDQVVAATHGRGVWSVALPELAGYTPPVAVRSPRLRSATAAPDGSVVLNVTLRSAYDSVAVALDGQAQPARTDGLEIGDTTVSMKLTVEQATTLDVKLLAYRDGRTVSSPGETVTVFPPVEVRVNYSNNFDDLANDDFTGDFAIRRGTVGGFRNGTLLSPSPYPDGVSSIAQLRVPILVANSRDQAVLTYRDIALVQAGDFSPEDVFPNPEFADYVVVEGSVDGTNWLPLADGYDMRRNPQWQQVWAGNRDLGDDLFVEHTLNLHDTFNPGDVVYLRFRLYADATINGYGWIIDDLTVQPDASVGAEEAGVPQAFMLGQNYPNPFNPATTIPFEMQQAGAVTLTVYDLQGRRVAMLADGLYPAGAHTVTWEPRGLASGVYLYRLEAGGQALHRTLTLLK